MRSKKSMPRPTYFFAIETTSRRLASVSWRLASSPSIDERAVGGAVVLGGFDFAGFDAHGERLLSFHRKERDAADFLEVHPDRIVQRHQAVRNRPRLPPLPRAASGFLFFRLVDDLDTHRRRLFEEVVDHIGTDVVERVECEIDFFIGQRTAGLAAGDQFLLELVQRNRRLIISHCRGSLLACHSSLFTPFLF